MKYLNKIIFVNSANIPYAEISVDGNVHFTGTQGVGKSTVLRALLFFYNADKHRLGIQQAQKSFDEFYFRQSNSYILYEVMRDNGAYTILVSRYQGRASWRFIDAPYQREWLIDEDKQVLSDWVKIRERIDKNVSVSARIDSGVMFKDIIFGNTHDHKYTRFALVQSAHYQNIPRSIQNVFLNTKLDADFVKNTIIQSMADEDLPIDLQTYRRLVTDFEREYDEIDCWFRQTRDGNYPVRQQALKIAEQGRRIVALDQQLTDVWRMLNHAVTESEQKIPLLEAEASEVKTNIERESGREKELTAEYDKENNSLRELLGEKKGKLKEIAQARKDFAAMGIEEKLALAAREDSLRQEAADKQMLLDDLLKTHASIEEKYNIARGKLGNARQAFENSQKEAYYQKQGQLEKERKRLENERTKSRNAVMDAFNNWRHESDERLQMLLAEQSRADNAVKELRQWHPKAEEMVRVKGQLQQLEIAEKENAAQQTAVKSQIAQLTTEYEMKEAELKQAVQREQERLEESRTQYREQIAKIEALLSHLDGSLYQWLAENADGWEDTIGKVVDEERILYAEGLEPQLSAASDTLFGVKLNLDNIDAVHRTPDDYREEKRHLEEQLQQTNRQLTQLLMSIHDYTVENALSIGELNLFSSDNRDEVNRKVVDYLKSLSHQLQDEQSRPTVSLCDAFRLQFRVKENDNDTNWVERINNVGSDGTDILVKAMVNIMLINVFKKKAERKSGGFIVHCMMDEIGRLHPNNIKGILQFANSRNIYLINSSPTSYNPYDYKYTYLLSKHGVKTRVDKLLKRTK